MGMETTAAALKIDHKKDRYPYCIVWTPLPVITWFLPFIGHTGIGDSNGVLWDFAGPYYIGKGELAFGKPTRFIQLDPLQCDDREWDLGVEEGNDIYSQRMHNICCDNCHSHVAQCLNIMSYGKKRNWGMVKIAVWMFFCGKFVSLQSFLSSYTPFAVVLLIILLASGTIVPF